MAGLYRRLATNMNVPPVDENLHIRWLRNRNIPYNPRHRPFANQNNKTKKPDIPPTCSSLTTNHQMATADISAQLPSSRNKFLTFDQTCRHRSSQHQ